MEKVYKISTLVGKRIEFRLRNYERAFLIHNPGDYLYRKLVYALALVVRNIMELCWYALAGWLALPRDCLSSGCLDTPSEEVAFPAREPSQPRWLDAAERSPYASAFKLMRYRQFY